MKTVFSIFALALLFLTASIGEARLPGDRPDGKPIFVKRPYDVQVIFQRCLKRLRSTGDGFKCSAQVDLGPSDFIVDNQSASGLGVNTSCGSITASFSAIVKIEIKGNTHLDSAEDCIKRYLNPTGKGTVRVQTTNKKEVPVQYFQPAESDDQEITPPASPQE